MEADFSPDSHCRYFTTPIFYANGQPHGGHFYATLLADILKAHFTHRGANVLFLTGLDEHGEAVESKARELGVNPHNHVDHMAEEWQKHFASFKINYDIFMRTTSPNHVKNVQEILQICYEKGDIYYGEHEGHYCIKCEGFLTSAERDADDHCLIHKQKTELRREKNYFFRSSKYRPQLKELISAGRITTNERYQHELLGMLEHLEGDLSISRPKTRLTWGIELPFDPEHVAYVWFDALPNYVTGIGGLESARNGKHWKNVCHILGKDILKFHGIFWPAMCLSLEIPVPRLLVTGWLLKDGHKMSKSLGNVVTIEQILHYGRDMFVNYAFRTINPGEDIDISWKSYFERYNADLANGIGNLLARVLGMIDKYFQKTIPQFDIESLTEADRELEQVARKAVEKVKIAFDHYLLADALNAIWEAISVTDKYISDQKPWTLAKEGSKDSLCRLKNVLASAVASLRVTGLLSAAFFPEKMEDLLISLGEDISDKSSFFERSEHFQNIHAGYQFQEIPRLYGRLDVTTECVTVENLAQKS